MKRILSVLGICMLITSGMEVSDAYGSDNPDVAPEMAALIPVVRNLNQEVTTMSQDFDQRVGNIVDMIKTPLERVVLNLESQLLLNRLYVLDGSDREYKIITQGAPQYQLTLTEDNTPNGIMGYNLNNNTIVITDTRRFYNGSDNTNSYVFINVGNDNNIILSPRSRGMVFEGFSSLSTGSPIINGSAIYGNNLTTIGLLMFRNCSSSSNGGNGGAIYCNGIFTMTQGSIMRFIGNTCHGGFGGAIACNNSITLPTTGNISSVRDPSNYQELEDKASVYFYGNRGRFDRSSKPNDIYIVSGDNLTIDGNGICAMYGGIRGGNDITITKNGKGLYILGNIGDMAKYVFNQDKKMYEKSDNYLPITINDGVLCLLATLQDLDSYKGTITINGGKLVIWLADADASVYDYGLKYFTEPGGALEAINNSEVTAGSLLEKMRGGHITYSLQKID